MKVPAVLLPTKKNNNNRCDTSVPLVESSSKHKLQENIRKFPTNNFNFKKRNRTISARLKFNCKNHSKSRLLVKTTLHNLIPPL